MLVLLVFIITGCANKKNMRRLQFGWTRQKGWWCASFTRWISSCGIPRSRGANLWSEKRLIRCAWHGVRVQSAKLISVLAKMQSHGRLNKFKSRVGFFVRRRKASPCGVASGFHKTVAIWAVSRMDWDAVMEKAYIKMAAQFMKLAAVFHFYSKPWCGLNAFKLFGQIADFGSPCHQALNVITSQIFCRATADHLAQR